MKIVILSFYSGEIYRGVETFVHEISNKLSESGHEVVVCQNGPRIVNSKYKSVTIALPINWEKTSSRIPLLGYWSLLVRQFTIKALKQVDCNVDFIIPTNGQWQSILSRVWAKRHGVKMIISGQSGPGLDDRINLFTFPDTFVSLTDYQLSWAKKTNSTVRHIKIPNGVDLDSFSIRKKNKNTELESPVILAASALVDWKRLHLAIQAVSKLKQGSLLLVGKGDQESNLKKLGEQLLPNRLMITSATHSQMPTIYASADLFTFPTVEWESFGIVLVEAMAMGLPIVATDDPIRREIVGDAGYFVNPENTEEYAAFIQKALKKNWGNKPRQQAMKFSWDNIAKQYEKLFLDLKKDG